MANGESIKFVGISNQYVIEHYELMCQFKGISSKENPLNLIKYDNFIENIKTNPNHNIYIGIINNKVVCSGTLLIEPKIIHNFSKVGHIEDIIVDNKYRRKGYGKQLISFLVNKAKENECYKTILNCSLQNIPFYQRLRFELKEQQMAIYFK